MFEFLQSSKAVIRIGDKIAKVFIVIFLSSPEILTSQDCGTAGAPPEFCRWGLPHPHCQMDLYEPKCVRVKFHHVNNTGGPISPSPASYFLDLLNQLNHAYSIAKIQFTLEDECVHRVTRDIPSVNGSGNPIPTAVGLGTLLVDDDGYLLPDPDEALAYEAGFINIYLIQSFTGVAIGWRPSSIVAIDVNEASLKFGLLIHEVGHTLGLEHTYRSSDDLNCSCKNLNAINSNTGELHCLTAHDCLCDTDLDPYGLNLDDDNLLDGTKWVNLTNCTQLSSLTPDVVDGCEDDTTPWDIPFRNYMGYYAECRSEFTPCQMSLMHDILEELESDLVTTGCMEICDSDIEVKTEELWENQTIELCQGQNIIISEDGFLTIRNCTLTVSEPIVSPNGQCPDLYPEVFWGGIFITGKSVTSQPGGGVEVGGKLRIEDSVIEYAWNGITVPSQFGEISIESCKILKSGRVLDVRESWPALPPSNGNNLSENVADGRDNEGNIIPCLNMGPENPAPFIDMIDVTISIENMVTAEPRPNSQIKVVGAPLTVSNCDIRNTSGTNFTAMSHSRGRLTVTNTSVIDGFLIGVVKGIDLTYPCSSRGLVIRNSSFLNGSGVENHSAYLDLTHNYFEATVRSNGISYQNIYGNHFKDKSLDLNQPIVSAEIRENYFNKSLITLKGDNTNTLPTCNQFELLSLLPAIEIDNQASLPMNWGSSSYHTGNQRPMLSDPIPLILRYGSGQIPCVHHITSETKEEFQYIGAIIGNVISQQSDNSCLYNQYPININLLDTTFEQVQFNYLLYEEIYDSLITEITQLESDLESIHPDTNNEIRQRLQLNEFIKQNIVGNALQNLTYQDSILGTVWSARAHLLIDEIQEIYNLWYNGSWSDISSRVTGASSQDALAFVDVINWIVQSNINNLSIFGLEDARLDTLVNYANQSFGDYTNIVRTFLLSEYDIYNPWPLFEDSNSQGIQTSTDLSNYEQLIWLYPNPSYDCFSVVSKSNNILLGRIIISAPDGTILWQEQAIEPIRVCLFDFPKGLYYVSVTLEDSNIVKHFAFIKI